MTQGIRFERNMLSFDMFVDLMDEIAWMVMQ